MIVTSRVGGSLKIHQNIITTLIFLTIYTAGNPTVSPLHHFLHADTLEAATFNPLRTILTNPF